jgi:hypothetical protein
MKGLLFAIVAGAAIFSYSNAFAKDPPTSVEQLRSEFEAALQAKDTNAILSLFNWEGVTSSTNSYPNVVAGKISQFLLQYPTNELEVFTRLRSLPDDFETEGVINGIRYRPNVSVTGMITGTLGVKRDGTNFSWGTQIPYGAKNGRFYFAGTTAEKIYEPKTRDRILVVAVSSGAISDDSPTFTGTCIYVQNGADIKRDIRGKGTAHKTFYGDYVKACTVKKTDGGSRPLNLEIHEGIVKDQKMVQTTVFSGKTTATNDLITYERKQQL